MFKGTIKFCSNRKDYGLIQPKDSHDEIYDYANVVERAGILGFCAKQKVKFKVRPNRLSELASACAIDIDLLPA